MTPGALPAAADLVDALRRDPGPSEGHTLLTMVLALHENNEEQWAREDDARVAGTDDRLVAAAKRDIDRLNRVRHRHIESIDRAVAADCAAPPSAPLVTESPGMAIDRLSVLVLRVAATEKLASAGDSLAAERLPQLHEQLDALEAAIDQLTQDLADGRRRFFVYESFKLYGPDARGQLA